MKADLHCHSYFSDGKHSPEYLVDLATQNHVTHLAITDHDCVTVEPELITNALQLIAGVEISCQWNDHEIHLVGLAFDPRSEPLLRALATQRQQRRERAFKMAEKLPDSHSAALKSYLDALPCIAYTRTHIADYLIQARLCKNHEQAFKKYLTRRGKIFEPIQWMGLETAIDLVHEAGGVTVLAHPSRYRFTRTKLKKLLTDFSGYGGTALETSYSNLDPASRGQLTILAEEMGLMVSSGSDFHSDSNHWTSLGKFPVISADTKNAIWNHPRWHSLSEPN
ncbi:MAG: putative metal-dependent phosphoesterase TrpH [Pseudohongiellaceae bacterium]|jgi:predicted metal-dependent phosphoesterase TrpH